MAEAAAAPAEGAAPPAPKKGMMIGLLVGGLVLGGATGTFVVAPKLVPAVPAVGDSASAHGEEGEAEGEGEHGKAGEGEEGAAPKMVTLDNIIVNPAGSQGSRFLMTSVAIATEDEKLETALRDRQVELRDKVTTVLEVMTMQQLTAVGARDTVKTRVQAMVVQMLGGKPKVKVFIPQFVIQ
jgi:flagellar FliL protein